MNITLKNHKIAGVIIMSQLLVMFSINPCWSQNLIVNPDFELGAIPTGPNQVNLATGWSNGCGRHVATFPVGTTNPGTPDLFDKRSTDCTIDIPSNKWSTATDDYLGTGNRYVGFSGGYIAHTNGTSGGPFYGETILATLTEPLTYTSCQYSIQGVAALAMGRRVGGCGNLDPELPGSYNRIQVVLRKDNNCTLEKVVFTTQNFTATSWTPFTGSFALTPSEVGIGYNRIEFRLTPTPSNTTEVGRSRSVFLGNVSLTKGPSNHLSSDFTLTATNPTGSLTHYLVTATVASVPPETGFDWEVCEVNPTTNAVIPGTCLNNPTSWWAPSLSLNNTFPGYCCSSSTTTGNGLFLLGKKYRVTRGTAGPCNPRTTTTKYVFMSNSGMVVSPDDEPTFDEPLKSHFAIVVPSPANESMRVESNLEGQVQGEIYTSAGILCKKLDTRFTSGPVDISELGPGIYFLSLRSETGLVSTRFVIDR
ncbi:MAG: T9SS type A sorting domain-containing protein [Flavobacteriales bacterium]|nr:T9SS type A sorting domain-containing protein [Flavobacteriales bacterium]